MRRLAVGQRVRLVFPNHYVNLGIEGVITHVGQQDYYRDGEAWDMSDSECIVDWDAGDWSAEDFNRLKAIYGEDDDCQTSDAEYMAEHAL